MIRPRAGGTHVRHHRTGDRECSGGVHRKHRIPLLVSEFPDNRVASDPGVVHRGVDSAGPRDDLVDGRSDRIPVADVDCGQVYVLDATPPGLVEPGLVVVEHRDPRPGEQEVGSDLVADPPLRPPSGDQDRGTTEIRCDGSDAHQILSMIVALAIPPPSHIVCSPYRPPVSSR